jgi:hypothetical protein
MLQMPINYKPNIVNVGDDGGIEDYCDYNYHYDSNLFIISVLT